MTERKSIYFSILFLVTKGIYLRHFQLILTIKQCQLISSIYKHIILFKKV